MGNKIRNIKKKMENPNSIYHGLPLHKAMELRELIQRRDRYNANGYKYMAESAQKMINAFWKDYNAVKLEAKQPAKYDDVAVEKLVVRYINENEKASAKEIAEMICDDFNFSAATFGSILKLVNIHKVEKYAYTKAVFYAYR